MKSKWRKFALMCAASTLCVSTALAGVWTNLTYGSPQHIVSQLNTELARIFALYDTSQTQLSALTTIVNTASTVRISGATVGWAGGSGEIDFANDRIESGIQGGTAPFSYLITSVSSNVIVDATADLLTTADVYVTNYLPVMKGQVLVLGASNIVCIATNTARDSWMVVGSNVATP